jgi:hypothetical protein
MICAPFAPPWVQQHRRAASHNSQNIVSINLSSSFLLLKCKFLSQNALEMGVDAVLKRKIHIPFDKATIFPCRGIQRGDSIDM